MTDSTRDTDATTYTKPEVIKEWQEGEALRTLYECPTCGMMWHASGHHPDPVACPWDGNHP